MRIGLQTWGSHGDIRPMLALAAGLRASGHRVSLAITSVDRADYADALPDSGIDIQMIASPVLQDPRRFPKVRNLIFHERNPVRQVEHILEQLFLPAEAEMMQAAQVLCAGNDLVIGHYLHYPLRQAAEQAGVPHACVTLAHSGIPTDLNPPTGFPHLGRIGNRMAWRLVQAILDARIKPYADRLRRAHGMNPAKSLLNEAWSSRLLNLVAVSPMLCERPADWPDSCRVCGFLDLPGTDTEGAVPPEVEAFLAAGEPPLFMTFGSVLPLDIATQRETLALLAEAATLAGCRALIQAPDWRECGMSCSESALFIERMSHALVFPRCRAVVHHGGAGTSHAAARAGTPSVVVAHIGEQEFWGGQLQRLGIAPPALKRRGLTAARLATRIREAVASREMQQNAALIGARMQGENGVGVAVAAVSELISDTRNFQIFTSTGEQQ